jgi:predicted ATPase/DNA-binding CsgD family transcriptional regulator
VALFLQRAQAVKLDFQLTGANARTVAEVCARLDGLPLAIELAAARSKLFSPQALLARLEHRLQVLTSGSQDAPARQQTLRKTLQWSYDLLDTQEQRLFRHLSIFVGGCELSAVEVLCGEVGDQTPDVLNIMASLLNKSLVQQVEQEGNEPRFMMLESTREFGLEALVASGEMEAVQRAHATYYLVLLEKAELEYAGPQQASWLERLEQEHDNLRAALHWLIEQGEKEMVLRLSTVLLCFWRVRGHASEGRQWLDRALRGSEGVQVTVRAKALLAAADLAFYQRDLEHAISLLEESLALYTELADKRNVAHTLMQLKTLQSQGLPLAEDVEEALRLFKELGDREGVAKALEILGGLSFSRGDYAKAHALFDECLQVARDLGDQEGQAGLLGTRLARIASCQGDHVRAYRYAQESLELSRDLGDRGGIALSLNALGEIALNQGDFTAARPWLEEALARAKEGDSKWVIAQTLSLLARMAFGQHDYDSAYTLYKDSLTIVGELHDTRRIASGLEGLGEVVAAQGQPSWAARFWGAAETLREAIGERSLPPVERANYEQSVAAARAQLGEKTFAAAWAQGRTMTAEQALAAQGVVMMATADSAGPSSVPHVPKASTYPDDLTAREVEVLRLVAKGLTNAQVAEQLVISPRTVNTHLTSIYSKIGVSSRSAATRYAIDHHLL